MSVQLSHWLPQALMLFIISFSIIKARGGLFEYTVVVTAVLVNLFLLTWGGFFDKFFPLVIGLLP
jgi:hypothetical protein